MRRERGRFDGIQEVFEVVGQTAGGHFGGGLGDEFLEFRGIIEAKQAELHLHMGAAELTQ